MALFTSTDRDAIKSALITAATDGVASVTIGGETVVNADMDKLRKLLDMVQADLASAETGFGMRFVKTVPPSPG